MDATITDQETARDQETAGYKSRRGALVWFFRKSRDGWKRKHQALKATVKKHENRVADVTKSREKWKLKAEAASQRSAILEAEKAELLTRISALEEEKKTPAPATRR
jgi:chromosome segregation ATPase